MRRYLFIWSIVVLVQWLSSGTAESDAFYKRGKREGPPVEWHGRHRVARAGPPSNNWGDPYGPGGPGGPGFGGPKGDSYNRLPESGRPGGQGPPGLYGRPGNAPPGHGGGRPPGQGPDGFGDDGGQGFEGPDKGRIDRSPGRGPPGGQGPPGLQGRPGNGPPGHGGGRPPGQGPDGNGPPGHNKHPNNNQSPGQGGGEPPGHRPRPDQSGCGDNTFTCGAGDCVPITERCDGVAQCRDGSDELNCAAIPIPTSVKPPVVPTTEGIPTPGGCRLPEQPKGGRYELGGCYTPCSKSPGDVVPSNSILTYSCDDGYTIKGSITISVCLNEAWLQQPSCIKTCRPLSSSTVDITCTHQGSPVSCEAPAEPGTRATLACKHSHKIPLASDPAYRQIECLSEGVWNQPVFRCLAECGTAVAHGNTLIVNGFTAKLGVFPWHAGIYRTSSDGKHEQICAGTLISNNLVVSAAHCFYDDSTSSVQSQTRYSVAVGKHYRDWSYAENYAQKSDVDQIKLADRYQGASGNFAQDIALVYLKTPFTLSALVRPVCLDWDNTYEREQLQPGHSGKAVGWGKTAEGVSAEELQEINLPFIPYSECVSAVPEVFRPYVTGDKFCAGYLNGSSLCEGDSGGGLCFQMDGLWYLRGVVSVSPVSQNTCDNNYYTAFTNVGNFREWLQAAFTAT